ncbi:DNA-J related domain-containing protein [uncultured Psychromonas sp.]|uniref:DNA-J related domain-containing protein n=1 Tax=uncultured Psychromonas sp. TaxID=173974 RepID=UPI00262A3422|nr:DNA-J related domain-containing protein [uncultured Psychromonas sp.]
MTMNHHIENPLIWPLLTLIKEAQERCQIHHLATELQKKGLLNDLDNDPNKNLFKRNFLLMNALYQLQEMLLPAQWLQVEIMNIQLLDHPPTNIAIVLDKESALRHYYLDWQNFETNTDEIEAMLTGFWERYHQTITPSINSIDKANAFKIFGLNHDASSQQIRQQWRRLALELHPDRTSGNKEKFLKACEAWQVLKE